METRRTTRAPRCQILRREQTWERIDERYRTVAELVFATLDGDRADANISELDRRIKVELKRAGHVDVSTPQRLTAEYLAHLKRGAGATTRTQRSRSLQRVSGKEHFPAIRPGQIVAIDATRADNLVYDPLLGRPFSVEILTAIDVATRVVLALRVVPKSADGIDAGLLLYDICRPFSMMVEGTTISHWRWAGLPQVVDASDVAVNVGRRSVAPISLRFKESTTSLASCRTRSAPTTVRSSCPITSARFCATSGLTCCSVAGRSQRTTPR